MAEKMGKVMKRPVSRDQGSRHPSPSDPLDRPTSGSDAATQKEKDLEFRPLTLDLAEASEYSGLPYDYLYNVARKGWIDVVDRLPDPFHNRFINRIRFRPSALEAFVRRCESKAVLDGPVLSFAERVKTRTERAVNEVFASGKKASRRASSEQKIASLKDTGTGD